MKNISNTCRSRNPFGISNTCLSQNPFGIRSNFDDWKEEGVKCYHKDGKNILKSICGLDLFVDKFNIKDKFKVCISKTNDDSEPSGPYRITTSPSVFEKNSITSETFLVLNTFDKQEEAENFSSFVRTKFFRFLISLRKSTHNISKDCFSFVPDVEDYSKPWTDKELYKRYNLTEEEIAYIESKIKSL